MDKRFEHGDDGYRFEHEITADFSTNTWYLGPDPHLLELLKGELAGVAHYPEVRAESFVGKVATHHGLSSAHVLAVNGTAEAIFLIARLLTGKHSRIITPTFSEYEHACEQHNHKLSFCGASFAETATNTPFDVFWLCNPNNPTGHVIKAQVLKKLILNNPQTTFVVDEAYVDFCLDEVSIVDVIPQAGNLIVLKSLTKNNCLPGLRLGYVLSQPAIISRLAASQVPWSVNSLAIKAGCYAIDHPRMSFNELLMHHSLSRDLQMQLSQLPGCEVLPTQTGYFLLKTPLFAADLKKLLVQNYGILVRDASNFRTLSPNHIRLSALSSEKNEMLVGALKTELAKVEAKYLVP